MFCKNCGAEIDDKAVVCPKCGVPVGKVEEGNTKKGPVSILSIVGFCLGVVSWFLALYGTIAIAGLVCSIIGVVRCGQLQQRLKGLGIAGIAVSAVSLVYTCYVIMVALALFA